MKNICVITGASSGIGKEFFVELISDKELRFDDFWVIATQMEARDNYYEIDYTDMNFALVMGSEGSGISKTILNKADFTVKLESNFESLNVSAATAVIVYEAVRQINIKKKRSC